MGADLSSLRMSLVTGEATTPAMKADMVRLMAEVGSKECLVLNRYGSTEASSMIQCEDDFDAGWHNPSPDMTFLETVHPDTHEPTAPGEPGLLLITHLSRRGTMLLRYAVGDIVTLDELARNQPVRPSRCSRRRCLLQPGYARSAVD
jgi:phenylacetate-coenzyme A ligase PaaK-like adenylate-forming protein